MAKRVRLPRGKKIPQFWSASRYASWRECAYRYMLQHILKIPTPPVPAMVRGIKIHKLGEGVLKGEVTGMPKELSKFRKEILGLKKLGVEPEQSWTLTRDFEQTYGTDWDRAWCRAKIDAHHYFEEDRAVLIVDFKTGRVKVTQMQMDLYAAMAPFYYPDLEEIEVELWFLDHGETERQVFTLRQAQRLWKKFVKRADDMLSDKKFLPTTGYHCKRCPFNANKKLPDGKNGPCLEGKRWEAMGRKEP